MRSFSGKFNGGSERGLRVELDFLISLIVSIATTVFLKMLLSVIAEIAAFPWFTGVSPVLSTSGNTISIMFSHSFTSCEMRSVVKKGCSNTFLMKGDRNNLPVLLSYFLRILAKPVE